MPGNSELQSSLITTCAATKKAEEDVIVSFQGYNDEASEIWNRLDSTSGSEGYRNDFEAASDFRKLAVKIKDRISEDSSYETKWSALDALTLISLQIVDGYWGGVGSGVRKYWQQDTRLSQAMRHVLDAMTEEEIKLLRDDEEYVENLEVLQENAVERGLKMGFDLILKSLTKKQKGAESTTAFRKKWQRNLICKFMVVNNGEENHVMNMGMLNAYRIADRERAGQLSDRMKLA
ncbi:hypothetical protein LTR27_004709 [Elasticomyces elasticus]|nr:hypothetical protein LTR27_004709 [Elasticomyces elasticus]